jgi:hypothetical protein
MMMPAGNQSSKEVSICREGAILVLWVAESVVGGLALCALPSLAVVQGAWAGAIPVPIIIFFCSHGCCTTMTFVLIPILPPGGRAEHTHTRGGLEHPPQSGLVEQFSKDGPPIHSWSVGRIKQVRPYTCGCHDPTSHSSCHPFPSAAPSRRSVQPAEAKHAHARRQKHRHKARGCRRAHGNQK